MSNAVGVCAMASSMSARASDRRPDISKIWARKKSDHKRAVGTSAMTSSLGDASKVPLVRKLLIYPSRRSTATNVIG